MFVGNNGHLHNEIDLAGSENLGGMKVATSSLNWFPLSSTFSHGVSVLALGRLPFLGYAAGHSSLASVDGSRWSSLASSFLRPTSSLPQRSSSTSSLLTLSSTSKQQFSMKIDLFPSSTFLDSAEQSNPEDVSISMPGCTCKDVSVVKFRLKAPVQGIAWYVTSCCVLFV